MLPDVALHAVSTFTLHTASTHNVSTVVAQSLSPKRTASPLSAWTILYSSKRACSSDVIPILTFVRSEPRSQTQGGKHPVPPIEIVRNVPK